MLKDELGEGDGNWELGVGGDVAPSLVSVSALRWTHSAGPCAAGCGLNEAVGEASAF